MKIKIVTNFGYYIVTIPESNVHRFAINEYCEEIVECNK